MLCRFSYTVMQFVLSTCGPSFFCIKYKYLATANKALAVVYAVEKLCNCYELSK